jgi:hypothetical protein
MSEEPGYWRAAVGKPAALRRTSDHMHRHPEWARYGARVVWRWCVDEADRKGPRAGSLVTLGFCTQAAAMGGVR